MTKIAVPIILALLFLGYVATARAQGCGCEMPPELEGEPHLSVVQLPLVTKGSFAELGLPPTPDKPVRPPSVYLPIVGGAG